MNCNSRHTFSLYYKRLSGLINKWILYLQTAIQVSTDSTKKNNSSIRRKWQQFNEIMNCIKLAIETQLAEINIFRFEYVHCSFIGNKMGLGP